MNCGSRGWFKGGSAWQNPDFCYDGCLECISEAISAGAQSAQCDQTAGLARCWMGYQ